MSDDGDVKKLMRQALTAEKEHQRYAALQALLEKGDALPPSFIALVFAKVHSVEQQSLLRLATQVVSKYVADGSAETQIKKKLGTYTNAWRKAAPSNREALNIVKCASALLPFDTVSLQAVELLIVALGTIEVTVVSHSGPQKRGRKKALVSAYRHIATAIVSVPASVVPTLLSAADRYAKAPAEAVAALGIISLIFRKLEAAEQERVLVLITTMCMKGGAAVAKDVVRVAAIPLGNAGSAVLFSKLIPIVDRALLREPEAALAASSYFFRGVSAVDVSPAVGKSIIPAVIQAVKSSDAKTRSHGIALVGVLGVCVKDCKVLLDATTSLCAILKSARYAYQKVATVDAISALCCARQAEDIPADSLPVFVLAVSEVQRWLSSKKESNEEARSSGILAMVRLFSRGLACSKDNAHITELESCATFFGDTLNDMNSRGVPAKCFSTSVVSSLHRVISTASKTKQEDSLRALTILCNWAREDETLANELRASKTWSIAGDCALSPALAEPRSFGSVNEAQCALRCCTWMIECDHQEGDRAIESIFKLCLSERTEVSTDGIEQVKILHRNGEGQLISRLFTVLWNTQFCGSRAQSSVARSYEYDDGMLYAERLGRALLAAVLPKIPLESLPLILLATNHPRLRSHFSSSFSTPPSRYWRLIEHKLGEVEVSSFAGESSDWLEDCLMVVFGELGLRSKESTSVAAAISGLGALADEGRSYSTRVLRRSVVLMHPLALGASQLSQEAHNALKVVQDAKEKSLISNSRETNGTVGASRKGGKKHPTTGGNPRLNQQKQAEIDRARAAAANASAAAEKADAARILAISATEAIELSRVTLIAIRTLAFAAPKGAHNLSASMLSLVLPSGRIETLEDQCRDALSALTGTSSKRLSHLSVEIACSLYGLEREFDVKSLVSGIIYYLKDMVPPALSAEDFSLVSPVIRAALLRDPDAEDRRIMSGRRGSTKRRDAIAVVKAAAQVLVEHCKPGAVDSAVAAAASQAGSWAVHVLEREDGAFASAADVLALLTGTALTPGTDQLSQVLEGVISGKSSVRDAALAALARLPPLSISTIDCPRDAPLRRTLWLARFDPDEANAELADELWTNYKHPLFVQEDVPDILALLAHKESDIRLMSARAIASAVDGKEHESTRTACLPEMFRMYLTNIPQADTEKESSGVRKGVPSPVKRGRDRSDRSEDELYDQGWSTREGVALAIGSMARAQVLSVTDITAAFSFLSKHGLGDRNDSVRAQMSKAATAVVEAAGSHGPAVLLPMIEIQLNTDVGPSSTKEELLHADRTRENLVMCLGAVAGFLPSDDPRVSKIADQVMRSAMETPSEVVQNAAARCLVPLAAAAISAEREVAITKTLLSTIWNEDSSYGQRRGAAYALAGICRGLGLKYMKRSGIFEEIESAVAEKSPRRRQGAFIVVETSAILMGRLFEPYAVAALPYLLSCMGDSVVEVRNACWTAAQSSMAEISSQGVKMILPTLLEGLKDRQWRTKAGSAEVLGAMAFCAPRQLAQCLPQVVPRLADALADAHPRVVNSAESAINRIAAVVRSPEVRNLSPFLLASLQDPAKKTRGAIDAMLGTEFVHAIDAASLALLIPPLHRGLRDRNSELKKRSAAIVGSMCNNVSNHYDVLPYLDMLLPALRVTLLDAIPDVRRTSARAIGALAVSLGEKGLPDIVPWLINALLGGSSTAVPISGERPRISAAVISSSVERSGAAMGLAEVAASMTERRLDDVLGRVLGAGESSTEAREGSLMFIASLPRALGDRFETRLGIALSSILPGLADDSDSVREAALEAGRNLVSAYAKSSLEHLLPELLSAMREKLWRIRQAATQLLGDMLLVIAGARPDRPDMYGATSSAGNDADLNESSSDSDAEDEDGETEEDDEEDEDFESPEQAAAAMTTEATMKAIEDVLGYNRRNEVLAALYIIRCDVSIRVRQTGMQVWKTVVSNTPRVLREIMPSAVRQIVDALGDEDEERRAAAGKTLGDLSQKLGDRVVPEVLPALRAGIASKEASPRIRKGACEGLGELVLASPLQQLEDHAKDLIDAVYDGLCDELSAVRVIAADVFASLLRPLGTVAVDAVVPLLIERLSDDKEDELERERTELALDGLKQILRASGSKLMTIVVPRLLAEQPLNTAGARALATAAVVGESAFEPHIVEVVDAIIGSIESIDDISSIEPLEGILSAIAEGGDQSVKLLLDEVFSTFNDGYSDRRIASSRTCAAFCRCASTERVSAAASSLLEVLIRQLADTDDEAAQAAWDALKDLSDSIRSRALSTHIPTIRQSLRSASTGISVTDPSARIAGLQVPKAPAPFVPILTDGLLHGAPELREQAALGIGELVELTNAKSLGPFVIKLTGPLIRVMSDRFPWQVKAAILKALLLLLKKSSAMLRTFAPQLQSTFVKSLSDGSRLVRVRACAALGALVPIQMRLEPLLNDLVSLGSNGQTSGARAAAFHSCSQVFRLGKKLPDLCFTTIPESIAPGLSDDDDEVSKAAGRSLGFLSGRCNTSQYTALLDLVQERLDMDGAEYTDRVSTLRAIGEIYVAGRSVEGLSFSDVSRSANELDNLFESTIPQLQCAACETGADLFKLMSEGSSLYEETAGQRQATLQNIAGRAEFGPRPDVRVAALVALKSIVLLEDDVLDVCAPALVVCAAETNTGIRNAADRTLRRALLTARELTIRQDKVQVAKAALDEEDQKFIERRIPKLRALADSEDERD